VAAGTFGLKGYSSPLRNSSKPQRGSSQGSGKAGGKGESKYKMRVSSDKTARQFITRGKMGNVEKTGGRRREGAGRAHGDQRNDSQELNNWECRFGESRAAAVQKRKRK